jgi:hypothetical protein
MNTMMTAYAGNDHKATLNKKKTNATPSSFSPANTKIMVIADTESIKSIKN